MCLFLSVTGSSPSPLAPCCSSACINASGREKPKEAKQATHQQPSKAGTGYTKLGSCCELRVDEITRES